MANRAEAPNLVLTGNQFRLEANVTSRHATGLILKEVMNVPSAYTTTTTVPTTPSIYTTDLRLADLELRRSIPVSVAINVVRLLLDNVTSNDASRLDGPTTTETATSIVPDLTTTMRSRRRTFGSTEQ